MHSVNSNGGRRGYLRNHMDILSWQQVPVLPDAVLQKASLSPLPSVAPACLFGKIPSMLSSTDHLTSAWKPPFGGLHCFLSSHPAAVSSGVEIIIIDRWDQV